MKLCPRDQTELKTTVHKGVHLDECTNCKGIFFDRLELEKAVAKTDPDLSWLDIVLFNTDKKASAFESTTVCPHCKTNMEPYMYEDSSVIVNKCASCHGVWLDGAEFKKIISYLEGLVNRQSAEGLASHIPNQAVEVLVGPKSESEEFKDLLALARLLEMRWTVEHPGLTSLLQTYYQVTPFK